MSSPRKSKGRERKKSRHNPISPCQAGSQSHIDGSATSIRLATATTSCVLRARSPAHFLSSSDATLPLRKTTPSSTRTSGAVNQSVASRTLWRRRRISSSRAMGLTSTFAGASERSSLAAAAAGEAPALIGGSRAVTVTISTAQTAASPDTRRSRVQKSPANCRPRSCQSRGREVCRSRVHHARSLFDGGLASPGPPPM